jgi:uncharacterized membrane protein YgcG
MCVVRIVGRMSAALRHILLAGTLLLLLAVAAAAQSTPKLTSQITDQTGVLGSGGPQVQAALDKLLSDQDVQLWVVFIPTTDGPTAGQLAQQTFEGNGFGGNDILLLVAVNDHKYGWWEVAATGLPGAQIDSLLSSDMEPRFRGGDYAGGVADFASALGNAVGAARAPAAKPTVENTGGVPADQGSPGGAPVSIDESTIVAALWTILAIILIGCGVVIVALWFPAWRRSRLSAEERDKRTGELARQANKLLVETDDAVNAAQQELGFAEATFDEGDVKPFRDAIATAQDTLKKAFAIRQQLDDAIPEDQPTREMMYGQIIAGCQSASAAIDEQNKRIQALRDLARTAPQALAALPKAIETLQARLPAIRAAMKTLSSYAPSAWAAVKGNAEEADKRGHFAEQQIEKGKAALAEVPPDSNDVARTARAAQEAVAQANQLLDALEQMAAALEDARGRLDKEIADAEADLEAAKSAALGSGDAAVAPAASGDLARAEELLEAAKNQAAAQPPDTIAALKAAREAHTSTDAVLAGIREASSQQARARAAFDAARASADASVKQARAFISTRRNGVGRQARTRLAEAERHLGQADALAAADVATATTEANVATNMATAAYNLANGDFVDFERGSPPRSGGTAGGGVGGAGANVAGAILGGIIGGFLGGGRGGSFGGGFGGTRWGSGGGWTGGGGGGGFGGFGGGHGGGGGWSGGGGGHGGGGGW